MDKWDYISKIRNYPSNEIELLLDLMDVCNKTNLRDITYEEAKEYYENLKENKGYERSKENYN